MRWVSPISCVRPLSAIVSPPCLGGCSRPQKLTVAYRCEIVSEISCARPLAAFVSPSWLSGRPRPKIHVFRISLSVLRICSFFYPANPKIVAPKSTFSGQCASKFRGGNTRIRLVFRCFPHRTSIYPRFVRFSCVFRVLPLTSFSLLLNKHFPHNRKCLVFSCEV